jgi:hypothetical protein
MFRACANTCNCTPPFPILSFLTSGEQVQTCTLKSLRLVPGLLLKCNGIAASKIQTQAFKKTYALGQLLTEPDEYYSQFS